MKAENKKNIKIVCINCPMGCILDAVADGGHLASVSGNACARGEAYARQECLSPLRTVTTTVPVTGGKTTRMPVKTAHPIPKDKIMPCVRALRDVVLRAPVRLHDVAAENVCGTGVDMITTAEVEKE